MNLSDPRRRVVELRSDTFTLPTPRMLDAMVRADLGDDVYGEDPTVARLETRSAELLGKEAGCFLPSGTMANLSAIMTHCARGSKVIVGEESDIYVYEAGGAGVCGGVVYHPVPNRPDGTMDLGAVEEVLRSDPDDPQFALPALLCLENPQNRCGGRVLPPSHLAEAASLAREHGVAVHLDGARIFNAALAAGTTAAELAAVADSVQFCLSKGLAAPVGSMLVGDRAVVSGVRRVRKMLGGGMRQAGVLAAAGLVALDEVDRLADDHHNARRLAEGLAEIPGISVAPEKPETNMVYIRVAQELMGNEAFLSAAAARGVRMAELGHGRIRLVTHRGVDDQDVDHVLEVVRAILDEDR
ncbi:low-specificity L-threonine aldolase [Spirillospora sp. CA-294931]|uniref:low-specificity L-threonine aldolase n=1 Tax=Spirillospora sp. CA-294931 TaxID=3240042 RepID=UPI003D939FE6